ncbi:type I-E CRISPR-associated protein Cse1/CasA [Streptomyces sp. NPDC006386]|uniref:type I-E CRISPR-associated protein Cse1/CasA n=1 Tax=Streptomyces sp. NPDC006386 TaxID=3156762 RepID=UPI0033ABE924
MSYNLVTEPWIPVSGDQGQTPELSLTQALLEAHDVPSLALPAPTMLPALLRQVLLPVVLHALGAPRTFEDWQRRFEQGRFTKDERELLADYLRRHQHRFDLLSATDRPFAQVANLRAASGETKSATLLLPSVASGNNVPLFSAFTEADVVELTPPQAALWLLHAHCWDTAAIKTGAVGDPKVKAGKTTGNPTGPLGQLGVIVPVGRTLYETIMLNSPVLFDGLEPDDRPQWAAATEDYPTTPGEADPGTAVWSERSARGVLDQLTWQSRRIRLVATETPQGPRVTRVVVAAGDRLRLTPDLEPHTAWTHNPKPKPGQPALRPRRHRSGRSAWHGLDTLLALSLPTDGEGPYTSRLLRQVGELDAEGFLAPAYPLRVETYGLEYGNQSAVVENAIVDTLPMPVAALAAEDSDVRLAVLEAVGQADRVGRALDRLLMDLRRAAGGEPLPRDKGSRPSELLLYALDAAVRQLLSQLRHAGGDFDRLEGELADWEEILWSQASLIASQLLAAAPPTAFGGRETKEGTFRSAMAERGFRNVLYATLPRAADARTSQAATKEPAV